MTQFIIGPFTMTIKSGSLTSNVVSGSLVGQAVEATIFVPNQHLGIAHLELAPSLSTGSIDWRSFKKPSVALILRGNQEESEIIELKESDVIHLPAFPPCAGYRIVTDIESDTDGDFVILGRSDSPVILFNGLTRDVNGLVFFDDFNRPDSVGLGSSWIQTDGVGMDNIVDETAISQFPYGDAQIIPDISIPPSNIMQYNVGPLQLPQPFGFLMLRNQLDPNQNTDGILMSFNQSLQRFEISIFKDGIKTSSTIFIDPIIGGECVLRLITEDLGSEGLKVRGYAAQLSSLDDLDKTPVQKGDELFVVQSDESIESDIIRVSHGSNNMFDNVIMCGRNIEIKGLTEGLSIRALGQSVTHSAVLSDDGVAIINVDELPLPIHGVEVLNGNNVIGGFYSASGIWGGDRYTFSSQGG